MALIKIDNRPQASSPGRGHVSLHSYKTPCNISCDNVALCSSDDDAELSLIIQPASVCSYLRLELLIGQGHHRTSATFATYSDESPGAYPSRGPDRQTQHFSEQLYHVQRHSGSDGKIPKGLLFRKAKRAEHRRLTLRTGAGCTRFGFSLDHHAKIRQFKKIINTAITSGEQLHLVILANPAFERAWSAFSAIAAPAPHTFYPWLGASNTAPLVRSTPAAYSQRLPAVTSFIDAREYLAHTLAGYLLEEAHKRRRTGLYINGKYTCHIEGCGIAKPQYWVMSNVNIQHGHCLPSIGERVTILMEHKQGPQLWLGKVMPMKAVFAAKYAINMLINAEPLPSTMIRWYPQSFNAEAYLSFSLECNATQRTTKRITELMLDGSRSHRTTFWRRVLLAHDNIEPLNKRVGPYTDLPHDFRTIISQLCSSRNLNETQTAVVRHYFTNRLTLLRGGPGTGKSTIVDVIIELEKKFGNTVWACSGSKAAVDVLAEMACRREGCLHPYGSLRLQDPQLEMLKPNHTGSGWSPQGLTLSGAGSIDSDISDVLRRNWDTKMVMSIARIITRAFRNSYNRAWSYTGIEREVAALRVAFYLWDNTDATDSRRETFRRSYIKKLRQVQQRFVGIAKVVYSSTDAVLSPLLRDLRPDGIVVECSQTMEVSTVEALTHGLKGGRLQRVLLVGDEYQLTPSVLADQQPFRATLETTILERLVNAGHHSITLRVQYRMHPHVGAAIGSVSNHASTSRADATFLQAAAGLYRMCGRTPRSVHSLVVSPIPKPGDFDWYSAKQLVGSTSHWSMLTARTVLHLLCHLLQNGYKGRDIMVIALCIDQVRFLKAICQHISDLETVCIVSVEEAQGFESEVVIIDTVMLGEANGDGLAECSGPEHFNVAMSRARKGRLIVAHKWGGIWQALMQSHRKDDAVLDGVCFENIPDAMLQKVAKETAENWIVRSIRARMDPRLSEVAFVHHNIKHGSKQKYTRQRITEQDITYLMELACCDESTARIYLRNARGDLIAAYDQYLLSGNDASGQPRSRAPRLVHWSDS